MRLRPRSVLVTTLLLVTASCASIPPESVRLSETIGSEIASSRSAHLATVDAFYQRMKRENDKWVRTTYLPRLIENAQSDLAVACAERGDDSPECSRITQADIAVLLDETVAFRDEMQGALEKNRDDAYAMINDHYSDLMAANAALTGYLASAVDVDDATRSAYQRAAGIAGVALDYDAIVASMDQFLERAGTSGAKVSELVAELTEIVRRTRGNDPATDGESR